MTTVFFKYRTKQYGKWIPAEKKEWQRAEIDGTSQIKPKDQVRNALKAADIDAVEIRFKGEL